jgi:hypothetical protein
VYDNTWWWLGFKPKHVVIHVFNKARWNIVANEGLLYSFILCTSIRPQPDHVKLCVGNLIEQKSRVSIFETPTSVVNTGRMFKIQYYPRVTNTGSMFKIRYYHQRYQSGSMFKIQYYQIVIYTGSMIKTQYYRSVIHTGSMFKIQYYQSVIDTGSVFKIQYYQSVITIRSMCKI